MKVCLDLDMTLNDMSFVWCKHLGISPSDVLYYGWIRDALGKEADAWWAHPDAYNKIGPLMGADLFIRNLFKDGHDVFIVTHTHGGQIESIKDAWVKKYFGGVPVIHSGTDKTIHTKDAFLLDDCPRHVYDHIRTNHGCTGAIFNWAGAYGWSRPFNVKPDVQVCCNYSEAYWLIQEAEERLHV